MTIVDYKIFLNEYATELEDQVLAALAVGWQPYGPVTRTDGLYMQPMVRYNNE